MLFVESKQYPNDMKTEEYYYKLIPDDQGWRTLPNGNKIQLGRNVTISDSAIIGNYAKIGDNAIIGSNQTTEDLNKYFISTYPEKSIFWKWVTPELMSPGWGGSNPIQYKIGETLKEPMAVISDQQCGIGLHVFRPGIRPEFSGLGDPDHNLVCLEVEVNREDICFGGLPGNSDKIRVKKLKVLKKLRKVVDI